MRARSTKLFRVLLAGSLVLLQSRSYALPQGEDVVSGTASFDRTVAQQLHIFQTSGKLITNYDSFSIAQPELVQFHQPSSSSVALNRVGVGGDSSSIMGTMRANGQVFLINPNGIVFGSSAQLDVNGLVASTLNISNADFLAGHYSFQGQNGSVINQGSISAPGGYVALIGSKVLNTGTITAELGSVALVSGDVVTLSLDPQGIVNVAADQAASFTGSQNAAVTNQGTIKANGGKVLITAKSLNSVFDHAINNSGVIEAQTITEHNGKIVITGDDDVQVGGTIRGGDVKIVSTDGDVTFCRTTW
jgi:filamentous hemagglutinin family protein